MVKIIFLDLDGVLILDNRDFDPYLVPNLERIIKYTGAKVVVSSARRQWPDHLKRIENMVKNCCNGEVIGCTTLKRMRRIDQIRLWVEENKPDRWIALDDTNLDTTQDIPWLVQTDLWKGLTREDADKAIDLLNGNYDIFYFPPKILDNEPHNRINDDSEQE